MCSRRSLGYSHLGRFSVVFSWDVSMVWKAGMETNKCFSRWNFKKRIGFWKREDIQVINRYIVDCWLAAEGKQFGVILKVEDLFNTGNGGLQLRLELESGNATFLEQMVLKGYFLGSHCFSLWVLEDGPAQLFSMKMILVYALCCRGKILKSLSEERVGIARHQNVIAICANCECMISRKDFVVVRLF